MAVDENPLMSDDLFGDVFADVGERRPALGGVHRNIIERTSKTDANLSRWGLPTAAKNRGWKVRAQTPRSFPEMIAQLAAMKAGDTIPVVFQEVDGFRLATAALLQPEDLSKLLGSLQGRTFVHLPDRDYRDAVQHIETYECRI